MLTEVTAQATRREAQVAAPRRKVIHVPLLLFRRLLEQGLHEAKKTREGMPTRTAMLERTWFEQHVEPGWSGWESSFSNCCLMIGLNEGDERDRCIREIDRAWQKALTDWARRRRMELLDEIHEIKAEDNPVWARWHAIQQELPMPESEDAASAEASWS